MCVIAIKYLKRKPPQLILAAKNLLNSIKKIPKQNSTLIKKDLIRYTIDYSNPQLLKLYNFIAGSDKITKNKITFEKLKAHYLKVILMNVIRTRSLLHELLLTCNKKSSG